MEAFIVEGDALRLPCTLNTLQSSGDAETSSARYYPFPAEEAEAPQGKSALRCRFSVDKQRQDIDSFILQFTQTKMNLVRNFIPMQTCEMKRKGGQCQITDEERESDGDSTPKLTKAEPDSILETFKQSVSKIEDRIRKDSAKHEIKKEVGENRSKNVRTARVVIPQSATLTDGYLKINFATSRALGRAAPCLTWKQGIEIASDKFTVRIVKRAMRVQFASIALKQIERCTKLRSALQPQGRKLFKGFIEAIWQLPRGLPKAVNGLVNSGKSDFINAALNVLFYLKPFRDFMKSTPGYKAKGLSFALQRFCKTYQTKTPVTSILPSFQTLMPEFPPGQSACGHSYILKLLAKLDKELMTKEVLEESDSLYAKKLAACRKDKCAELHSMFSCLVESVFICSSCFGYWQTQSYSRSIDLPVIDKATVTEDGVTSFGPRDFFSEQVSRMCQLTGQNEMKMYTSVLRAWNLGRQAEELQVTEQDASLDSCLQYFLRASLMASSNTFECQHCGTPTQHFKQSFLRHLSKVLLIHFQRFNDILDQKLETCVSCPEELDMSKYCQDGGKYQLMGVINHAGLSGSGHYSAYSKVRGQWFLFDDEVVKPVERETDIFQAAYLVAYVRT